MKSEHGAPECDKTDGRNCSSWTETCLSEIFHTPKSLTTYAFQLLSLVFKEARKIGKKNPYRILLQNVFKIRHFDG